MTSEITETTQGIASVAPDEMDYDSDGNEVAPNTVDNRKRAATNPPDAIARRAPALTTYLGEHIHSLRQGFPSICGATQIQARFQNDASFGYEIAISHYIQDLRAHTTLVMPTNDNISLVRDVKGRIIEINDGVNSIGGDPAVRLNINYGVSLAGYKEVVYKESSELQDWSGLVIPAYNWVVHRQKYGEQDLEITGRTMFTKHAYIKLILPKADVCHFAAVKGMPLSGLPAIMKALSALRKVNQEFDVTTLFDLATVTQARSDPNAKRLLVALLDTLQAALLKSSNVEQRAAAFIHNPTLAFLSKLEIKRPFNKPLLGLDSKPVKMVTLSSLPPDAEILVQDLSIDGNFYESRLNSNLQVYTVGTYFMKMGKGAPRKLGTMKTMSAGALLAIIRAKEEASAEPKEVDVAVRKKDDDKEGGVEASLNAFNLNI